MGVGGARGPGWVIMRGKELGVRGGTLGMNEVIKGKVRVNIGFVAKSGQ